MLMNKQMPAITRPNIDIPINPTNIHSTTLSGVILSPGELHTLPQLKGYPYHCCSDS